MKYLGWIVAAVLAYQAYATDTNKAPRITHIVHATRLHFIPACPACGVKVLATRRTPEYRGYLRVEGR